jgi:hypothetical protein
MAIFGIIIYPNAMKFVLKTFLLACLFGVSSCNVTDDPVLSHSEIEVERNISDGHSVSAENSYTCTSLESIRVSDEPDFAEVLKNGRFYFSGTINDIKKTKFQGRTRFVLIQAKGNPPCSVYFPMNRNHKIAGYKAFTDKNFTDYKIGNRFHANCSVLDVDVTKDFRVGGCLIRVE